MEDAGVLPCQPDAILAAAKNPGRIPNRSQVAWTPSEFSYVRLEYSHGKADSGVHPTDDRIMIQMSYTIGYHPAHAY